MTPTQIAEIQQAAAKEERLKIAQVILRLALTTWSSNESEDELRARAAAAWAGHAAGSAARESPFQHPCYWAAWSADKSTSIELGKAAEHAAWRRIADKFIELLKASGNEAQESTEQSAERSTACKAPPSS